MNSRPVCLNHQKLSFVQNFKIAKIDYLDALLSVQGLFDDVAPPRIDLETLICCVGGFVSFSIEVANYARVSNPE
jgi:hypothetical protein